VDLIGWLLRLLFWPVIRRYCERILCQHFCLFKSGGSTFRYTHVHIVTPNRRGVTGVGHDDHTSTDDPRHNTISDGGGCTFKKRSELPLPPGAPPDPNPRDGRGIYPEDVEAREVLTLYFHECVTGEPCPPGYTRTFCRCRDGEGVQTNCCVCYTFSHDAFEAWYASRYWDHVRGGDYRYPYLTVGGPVPFSIACGKTVTLYDTNSRVVDDPASYGPVTGGDSDVMRELERRMRVAAVRISCQGPCTRAYGEIWRGWKCEPAGARFLVMCAMQWEVRCARP
jgi:hypothetical protein